MILRTFLTCLGLLGVFGLSFSPTGGAAEPLAPEISQMNQGPAPPETLSAPNPLPNEGVPNKRVYDPEHFLDPTAKESLNELLDEHCRLSGDDIRVAILARALELPLFQTWQMGSRSRGRGILIRVDPAEKSGHVQFGFGFDGEFSDHETVRIQNQILIPYLKQNKPNIALLNTAIELLYGLESPVIKTGRWEKLVQSYSDQHHSSRIGISNRFTQYFSGTSTIIYLFFAFIAFGLVAYFQLGAEAHFDSSGWSRYRPWTDGVKALIQRHPKKFDHTGKIYGSWS